MVDDYLLITGYKVQEELNSSRIGVLPIGGLQYHGPHLPIGTDHLIAVEVAKRVATEMNAVFLPPISYTNGYWRKSFQGTISINGESLENYLIEALRGILNSGLRGVLMLSGQGENGIFCAEAGRRVADEFPDKTIMFINWWDPITEQSYLEEQEALRFIGEHDRLPLPGSLSEGSIIAYLLPNAVDIERVNDQPYEQPWAPLRWYSSKRAESDLDWPGYWGRVSQISPEKGEVLLRESSMKIVALVRKLLANKANSNSAVDKNKNRRWKTTIASKKISTAERYVEICGLNVTKRLDSDRIGVLPIGSLEYHGPHLPLGTDSLIATEVASRVAEEIEAILFPMVAYTSVYWSKGFKGTISIDSNVFIDYMIEVLRGILRSGLGGVLMLSAHGENGVYCPEVARKVADEFPHKKVMFISWWDTMLDTVIEEEGKEVPFIGEHGGFEEGSLMAYIAPYSVDVSKASDRVYDCPWEPLRIFNPTVEGPIPDWRGYWGRVSEISPKMGKQMLLVSSKKISALVRNLLEHKA